MAVIIRLILAWILLHKYKTKAMIAWVSISFKESDSHIEKIENYKKEKSNEVALNHLKHRQLKK